LHANQGLLSISFKNQLNGPTINITFTVYDGNYGDDDYYIFYLSRKLSNLSQAIDPNNMQLLIETQEITMKKRDYMYTATGYEEIY